MKTAKQLHETTLHFKKAENSLDWLWAYLETAAKAGSFDYTVPTESLNSNEIVYLVKLGFNVQKQLYKPEDTLISWSNV